jgi:hypothetical protein
MRATHGTHTTNLTKGKIMAMRVIMPSGNSHSGFVIHSVKSYEGKGVVILDARGKPLEWIPVTAPDKAKRTVDMINGALAGERRYRTLDWSFLTETQPQPKAPAEPLPAQQLSQASLPATAKSGK